MEMISTSYLQILCKNNFEEWNSLMQYSIVKSVLDWKIYVNMKTPIRKNELQKLQILLAVREWMRRRIPYEVRMEV